jgi:hypothetical protein
MFVVFLLRLIKKKYITGEIERLKRTERVKISEHCKTIFLELKEPEKILDQGKNKEFRGCKKTSS